MKTHQLIGLAGILVLVISGFLPLAYINEGAITIYPVLDNYELSDIWYWRDISAFAVTYGITAVLGIYLLIKNYKPGYLIAVSLSLAAFIFMYISIWLTSVKVMDFAELTFSYTLWILFAILGYVLVYYGGLNIKKEKKDGDK